MKRLAISKSRKAIPVHSVLKGELDRLPDIDDTARNWAKANGFEGQSQQILPVPNGDGHLACVLFGLGSDPHPFVTGRLAANLPDGHFSLNAGPIDPYMASLGWVLGSYEFAEYRKAREPRPQLVLDRKIDRARLLRDAKAVFLARDLINTPTNDLGPDVLENRIRKLGRTFGAQVTAIRGETLLKNNFPMIHAVGRASATAPRLVDLKWGKSANPKITLVGKGVVFDTGGLNIKPGNSMALMKKDMGGAANVMALAQMIMEANLPVRLRLLVPAVENAISGNAFRPGDVLPSRKGLKVEIGNTDAEGRLILGDALALADEEHPDLLIDMATLTGAARVALGPELPPFYTLSEELAVHLSEASMQLNDPLWRMPLWAPYHKMLSSKVADINHISSGGFAGSITAALFLSRFVERTEHWCHLDIFGWTPTARPWAPVGGEAQGIRALYKVISEKFGN